MGAVLFTSCEKDRTTIQKEIAISEDIKGIVVEGAWDIHVFQSDSSLAYIEYSAFVEDRITAEVKNGNLYLKFRNKVGASRKDLVAHIKYS